MIYTLDCYFSFFLHSYSSLQVFYDCYLKKEENEDRSCYVNLMEDINNFKILIQKMKTHSLLFHFLMKSTTAANYLSNQQKDCYQIPPVILKLFG